MRCAEILQLVFNLNLTSLVCPETWLLSLLKPAPKLNDCRVDMDEASRDVKCGYGMGEMS